MSSLPMKTFLLALLVCAVTAVGTAQEPATTLKVDVKLVNVFVTVTDNHGAPVSNLQKAADLR